MKYDVLTAMDVCVDFIVRGNVVPRFGQAEQLVDDYDIEIGGSAALFASQCAKLGLATIGVGTAGDDAFGRLFIERLSSAGVDTGDVVIDKHAKTGVGIALCTQGDRAILTYTGTIDRATPEMVARRLPHTKHLHISSYYLMRSLRPHWPDLVRMARSMGVTVSLDTNWDPEEKWEGLEELAGYIDVFLPNAHEALALTRETDIQNAIHKLAKSFPLVVVKQGADGAIACQNGTFYSAPAIRVGCEDTIGAGDSFDGGFLYGWLNGKPIQDCLTIGSLCGANSITKRGGFAGQPTLADLPEQFNSLISFYKEIPK